MSNNLLKLVFVTNTKIRFIASLPSDLTIQKALPIILKKYKSVVAENYADKPELLNVNTVAHVTKDSSHFAKDQVLGHVLNNNDQLSIYVIHKNKEVAEEKPAKLKEPVEQVVEQPSKKEKLDNKKVEKAAQPTNQDNKKKIEEVKAKLTQKKTTEKQTKQAKKEVIPPSFASEFLNKFRSSQKSKESEPTVVKKKAITIVEEASDS